MNTREKNAHIQALRGFACILLVFYHVVGDSPTNGLRVADGPVRWLNDGLAYLRMPLFTFLSGWVYGLRPFQGDLTHFMAGKARRLLVPMLFVGTIFALMQAMVPGSNAAIQNWYWLHIEPVAHYWYLESLLWIFLGVALLDQWGQLGKPWAFAAWFAGVLVLYLTVRGPRVLGIEGAIYLAPYFLLGLIFSRFQVWHVLMHKGVLALLSLVALMAMVHMGLPTPNPDRRSVEMLLAGVCLCLLAMRLPLPGQWWARVGGASYAIYLFHVFFTAASRIATEKMGLSWLPLQLFVGAVLGIAGPMWVEKMASRQRISGWLMLGKSWQKSPAPKSGAVR